ncbi:MAG: hypothetical protein RLZZ436_541, partial [Planctomycetota bacterium]
MRSQRQDGTGDCRWRTRARLVSRLGWQRWRGRRAIGGWLLVGSDSGWIFWSDSGIATTATTTDDEAGE